LDLHVKLVEQAKRFVFVNAARCEMKEHHPFRETEVPAQFLIDLIEPVCLTRCGA